MTKILIVDNTLDEREDVYNTLLLEGYQVFQAKNGITGFEIALKENPDLIISEVFLPELSGLEMLKKLNEETTTNSSLIFLSKKNKKEDVRNGMNAGAEDYLEKPFDKKELITVVERIIKKQQLAKNRIQKTIAKDNYFQKEVGRMSKIGYWTYDKKSNIRTWSKVIREIFGISQEEIPSYDIMLNCLNKDSRKKHNKAAIKLAKNGESYDMEFEIKNLKNEKRWIQDIGEPIYNSQNQIIGQRGVVRDITLLKNDQEVLKESNKRFEFVARATNDAVWDLDLITGRIYRSRIGHKKVFGFHTKRVKEKYYNREQDEEDYFPDVFVHPDDRNRIAKELKRLIASLNLNKFSLEYRTPDFNGKCLHIKDKGFIVRDKKGLAIRLIGAASNITKRKQGKVLMIDEKLILEKIANNDSLKSILEFITLTIEKQLPNSFCSILLMDLDGIHLRHGAAPNLPKDYSLAIDGMVIGENAGSCGTAAYKKELVFVSDIATDPLWENYKKLALTHGLKACWSLPIISKKEDIVSGTFAIYYSTIKIPDPSEIKLLKRMANYVRLAIEKSTSTNNLINSETKYRNLFDRNLAGTYQTRIDGTVLRANTTFANILGYENPKQLLEQNANISYFSGEEREAFIKDLNKNKKLNNREKTMKHKNGSIVYILESCYLQGDPLLGEDVIEGVIIDITERKNIEKSLEESFSNIEAILESTADGILVVDNLGNIVRFNKKFLELWSIPEEVMLTMDDNKALDYVLDQLENPQKMLAKVNELYENPEAKSYDIIELKDGLVFERYSQPNVMSGVSRGRVWSFRNITERIKIRNELRIAKEHAEELVGFKDQFIANMSHEIRTPLGIILGFTKILLRNDITETQKRQLNAIKTSGDTLLVVINDILDLSKIEAGKMSLDETEIILTHSIQSVINTFELRLEEKELKLNTQFDNRIPKWLFGDPIRINQIVLNLIDNAIKFTPDGGNIDVKVNLLKEDRKKAILEIKVTDTGVGIPPDQLKNIFSPFTQSTSYTYRKYGGSGLGLNIVKKLINLMNGTISVKSELSVGSVFTFTLSLKKVSITEIKPKIIVSNDKKLEHLENLKILIVDDMLVNQFLAQTIIQDFGFESDIADNGKIAIELLVKNEYDVILMDLQMPEMSGWDATTYIRNNMQPQKATTPIIALTADITEKDIDRCKEVGMDEYVSKPINESELLEKIIRLATKKNKEMENRQEATKICNLEFLRNQLHNKPKLVKEMLEMILKELPVTIKQIGICIANNDWKELPIKIHSIKPTLDLMGLSKESLATVMQIKKYAEKQEHLDLVPTQFRKLKKALEKAYKELKAEIKLIKN